MVVNIVTPKKEIVKSTMPHIKIKVNLLGHFLMKRHAIRLTILYRVQALLCNVHEGGEYSRAVSGQRLCKHVPVARQRILKNATVELQQ
jgi:hypothetical protein